MIDANKIAQATKEIRDWAKEPGRSVDNPTTPEAETVDASETIEVTAPVDYYAQEQKAMREEGKKQRPHGSSTLVMAAVKDAVEGGDGREGLAHAYRRVRGHSEFAEKRDLYEAQYMQDNFLPVVESIVNFTSPDELLNNKPALRLLDQFAMGVGSGSGYTEGYVRQAYGNLLGQQASGSDQTVRDTVMRIKQLAASDQIRACYGMAERLKEKIDNGEHIADDSDYALLARIVAYK